MKLGTCNGKGAVNLLIINIVCCHSAMTKLLACVLPVAQPLVNRVNPFGAAPCKPGQSIWRSP
jgi:hypothetical protein